MITNVFLFNLLLINYIKVPVLFNFDRTYLNYINANNKSETPAMKLELAKDPIVSEKIIYFSK